MILSRSRAKSTGSTSSSSPKANLDVADIVGAPTKTPVSEPFVSEPDISEKPVVIVPPQVPMVSPVTQPPMQQPPAQQVPFQPQQYQQQPYRQPYQQQNQPQQYQQQGYQSQQGYRPRYNNGQNYRHFNQTTDGQIPDANVPTEFIEGVLDIQPEGHGFLRPKFIPSDHDVYISQSQIRRFNLRPGDMVGGQARSPKENERYYGLLKVEKINAEDCEKMTNRPRFDDLTPIYPHEQIELSIGKTPLSTRIIDLLSPIGRGQRGLIVSPPKAGKTTILKDIAAGISTNYPEDKKHGIHLMAVLVGERPEEVTDISRSVKGEVVASNFDEAAENQTRVAEIALDRAKRLVEMGKDVVILLDSITRLARAYNMCIPPSGRTLSGGFDPAALFPPKKFFGAARCFEKGGSLTIIGTALVDTGSRMDDLVYEEFKGTGNLELHLNRSLADKRIFPAIEIEKSGTRAEELLFDEATMKKVVTLRRMLELVPDEAERTQMVIDRLLKSATNKEFIESMGQ
jgi:transcription termination factor Rho